MTFDSTDLMTGLIREARRMAAASARAEEAMAQSVVPHAQDNAPVVTGQLRDSVHAEGNEIVADAPHAVIVELNPEGRGFGFFARSLDDAVDDALHAAEEALS
jgi:hypothetical protein